MLLLVSLGMLTACEPRGEAPAADVALTIAEIQGCSHRSPYSGKTVQGVIGIVTAKAYNGFYMQSEQDDDQNCSSEGIFVFTEGLSDVVPGDKVVLDGRVEEFLPGNIEDKNLTITELVDPEVRVLSRNNQLPDAVIIGTESRPLPHQIIDDDRLRDFNSGLDGADYFESLESMLVSIEDGVVVGARNAFNEVVVIPHDYQQLNNMSTTGALLQREDDANPERLILNLNSENMQRVNIGAELLGDVTGIIDYSYGNYKVKVFGIVQFTNAKPIEEKVAGEDNSLTVATYNVENLSFQDEDSKYREIALDIIDNLSEPQIVLLHEVMDNSGTEDDGTVSATQTIQRLIEMINQLGGPTYDFLVVDPANNQDGGISGGNIRSVMLYNTESGVFLIEDTTKYGFPKNPVAIGPARWPFSVTRKPLAALFNWNGHELLVVAVHLTSRGLDSPLFGSVQPIERLEEEKRVAQAQFLNEYAANFHLVHPGVDIILAGDLNDDHWSQTMAVLTTRALFDAGETIADNERFSFILDGNAFQLDHILVSDPGKIRRYVIPHLNSIYDRQLQTSDHDPVLIELDFDTGN